MSRLRPATPSDPLARRAALALTAVAVVWGSTFVLAQDLVSRMPVSSFLFWRFAIATIVMVAVRPRAVSRLEPRDRRRAVVLGLVVGTGFALQTLGLRYTTASVSGFVTGMFVVLTPVMSGLLFRERVPASVRPGVALAVVGLAVLSLDGWSLGFGEVVTLGGAVAFAAEIAMLGQWATSRNAYGVTLIQLGVVALVGAALTPVDGGLRVPASAGAWAGLAFLGLVASALAFTVQTWTQSHLSATRAAVIMTSEPLWAGVVGVLVAGEPATARLLRRWCAGPAGDVRRRARAQVRAAPRSVAVAARCSQARTRTPHRPSAELAHCRDWPTTGRRHRDGPRRDRTPRPRRTRGAGRGSQCSGANRAVKNRKDGGSCTISRPGMSCRRSNRSITESATTSMCRSV